MDGKAAVEAALFSSSENLKVQDIADRTGLDEAAVRHIIKDLRTEYDERDSAIMIAKIGSEYCMMLRPEYGEYTGKFAKAEMTPGMMRTLSTIAYNQPVLQSELFRTRGVRTYDDVHALAEMGFVHRKKSGQTMELTTTNRFSEYFGIGSTRVADIKKWIDKQAKNAQAEESGKDEPETDG
ncbi:MAG: SMC-Scp complex subunit ScpB [Candidatus Methanoplasma sp.]|jgi:segregation and condensation protein B|nr:SMC-Scp complex subunit ScpB [Candidatus Methanoplasma sp.]